MDLSRPIRITAGMVHDFAQATRDRNKAHTGKQPIALAFQLGGLVRTVADLSIPLEFSCLSQVTQYLGMVRAGAELEPEIGEVTGKGDDLEIKVNLLKDGQPVAESTLVYSQNLPVVKEVQEGMTYRLAVEDGERVLRGLGKAGKDLEILAFGLASNALYAQCEKIVKQAESQGKIPVYGRHILKPHASIEELQDGKDLKKE